VLNDGRHGIIRQMQQLGFGRAVADEIGPVDFAQLARSVGGVGIRVTTPVDLDSAVRDALQATARAPVLLDVVCDGTVPWPNRDKLVERGRALLEDER
jgi:acetolactate synthase-1/2/3 large subunit